MFCENCGSKVSEEDAFCTNCGNPLKKDEETKTPVEEQNVNLEQPNDSTQVNEEKREEVVETTNTLEKEANIPSEVVNKQSNVVPKMEKEKIKKGASGNGLAIILAIIIVAAIVAVGLYFVLFKDGGMFKKQKPIDALETAINNMLDIDSFTVSANIEVASDEEDMEASANLELSIDKKNKMAKLSAKVDYNGVAIEVPAYADLSNSTNAALYFKLPEMITGDSKWNKLSLDGINVDDFIKDTTEQKYEFKEEAKKIDFITKEKSEDKNLDKYKITLNKENLKQFAEMSDEDFDYSQLEEVGFEDGFSFYIYIDKKENYISKIEMNFKDYYKNEEVEFSKFNVILEIKDYNKVEKISIPNEAKKATELDFSDILGGMETDDSIDNDEADDYEEDYTISEYGYKVKYDISSGFEPSIVNSSDYKIYRKDDVTYTISNYQDSEDEYFDDLESDKEYYEKTADYSNIVLGDTKKITVKDKEFIYKELSYEYSETLKKYQVTICYPLDKNHVYRVEIEKSKNPITESEIKNFLNITVTK